MILNFFDELAGYANHSVWIGKIKLGLVVQATKFGTSFDTQGTRVLTGMFGHIAGFGRNSTDELILFVQWDNGRIEPVHPANVKLLDI